MPVEAKLATCLGQAQFLGEKAFGVVPYGSGFWIRVKSADFQEVLSLLQPEKRDQFMGKTWEVSGLPLAMGKESLQAFFGDWKIHPLHTFRHGFRRTWIVRATEQPTETTVFHDSGLAVIKEAAPRRSHPSTERFRVPRTDRSVQFNWERESNYPKSWAGIVAGSSPNAGGPTRSGKDGTVPASVASSIPGAVPCGRAQAAPSPMHVDAPQISAPGSGHPQAIPLDLASLMGAANRRALKPLKERLEATIIPMQRILESFQAEFVALRSEEKDEGMTAAADAKRMRTASDV